MRRTKIIVIDAPGRDLGKRFFIQEMPAVQVEEWATKALGAMMRADADVSLDALSQGVFGLAAMGLKAFLKIPFAEQKPLLDEMMSCVKFVPDAKNPAVTLNLIGEEIEEALTLATLKQEVFDLHTGFSTAAALSKLKMMATAFSSLNTPISPEQSAPSSLPA